MIKVLQSGYPKSGNYLLYKIISKLLKSQNSLSSFSKKTGISDLSEKFWSDNKIFPERSEVDNVRILNNNLFLETIAPDTFIEVDAKLFLDNFY